MKQIENLLMLRTFMGSNNVDACIIPTSDCHLSEYTAEHWKFREFLTEFTGSAATLVVTFEEAYLWTDSRYFLQAETELLDSGITLQKLGEPGVPSPEEWLLEALEPSDTVGIDGRLMSLEQMRNLNKTLKKQDIRLNFSFFAIDNIWLTRPPIPESPIYDFEDTYHGYPLTKKLAVIRDEMHLLDSTHYIVSGLDEIAWALNLRGTDIQYNPLFHAFLIISQTQVLLFINPHKIPASLGRKLVSENVKISTYSDFYTSLKEIKSDSKILIDPFKTNITIYSSLPQNSTKIESKSIINQLKSIKTETEIGHLKQSMLYDGLAFTEFWHWLELNISTGEIDEKNAAQKLHQLRSVQPGFKGDSFSTISAYGSNGAIVHYTPSKTNSAKLKADNFYLIDSGGQYLTGTTDVTRTLQLGDVSHQAKIDYTLVLKAHLALAMAKFPKESRGVHLDTIARSTMWKHGRNYGHGTGHGVGFFLSVHEGPQSLKQVDNGETIQPGMVISNEPGIYMPNNYGIRLENLVLTDNSNEFEDFLELETLTLIPFDTKPILKEMLSDEEISWLNNYHKLIFETLKPNLSKELTLFLGSKTTEI